MTSPRSHDEPQADGLAQRLNWLRAGVLGANDGIVSVAAVVVGVAVATTDAPTVLLAGFAALIGGAISMALGEYVSVSSQRDTERSLIAKERAELQTMPAEELAELAQLYEAKGLSPATARRVAEELTAHDALAAHLDAELHITLDDVVSPWRAAAASMVSFVLGAALPMLAITLPAAQARIPATCVAVLVALAATGAVAAWLGGAPWGRAVARTVLGGAAALAASYGIGVLLGS